MGLNDQSKLPQNSPHYRESIPKVEKNLWASHPSLLPGQNVFTQSTGRQN